MTEPDTTYSDLWPKNAASRLRKATAVSFALLSVGLLLAVLVSNLQQPNVSRILLLAIAVLIFIFVILLAVTFLQMRRGQRDAAGVIEATKEEFQEMASNIQEVFWMVDAESKKPLYVSPAYEMITGRSLQSLVANPLSAEEMIHPKDRAHILEALEEATRTGELHERFRILCRQAEIRWIIVHGFPVRDQTGKIRRLVGTAQEITAQKRAEDHLAVNLEIARSALAETEALHKATLALTQDLRMDFVMSALLRSLGELIPYTCARILVPDGGPHVLTLGEQLCPEPVNAPIKYPLTLSTEKSPFLQRVLADQKSILIADTGREGEWKTFKGHGHLRSWLSVPLVAAGEYLGFLSIGHPDPNRYTNEHLRRAELLAIPAAAAIQNARLYETAQIYGSELEKRIGDLKLAQAALVESEDSRKISEDKFQKVFRASPIPFSITTVNEGRFLDVNVAFERRYGYSRADLIGRTVGELRIWENPKDRVLMVAQLQRGGPIRNVLTRLRAKSGELKITAYSADMIQFDGQSCILAVSEDLPDDYQSIN
jgi:PAS domain S-box-containing protein